MDENVSSDFKKALGAAERRGQDLHSELRAAKKDFTKKEAKLERTIQQFEKRFSEYRAHTDRQIQFTQILFNRKNDALEKMEDERERLKGKMNKPSGRIIIDKNNDIVIDSFTDYDSRFDASSRGEVCYRRDLLGFDTSWKEYAVHPPVSRKPQARPWDPRIMNASRKSRRESPKTNHRNLRP